MTSNIIDGKLIAENLRASVKEAVSTLPASPTLAVVLVGDDPASQVYVRSKIKFTKECGMISLERRLPSNASQEDVIQTVRALNQDESVDGILVQLPLPAGLRDVYLWGKQAFARARRRAALSWQNRRSET